MSKYLYSIVFGAAVIFAVEAASAQPADIEAKAQVCSACHGANGVPLDPKTMPIIWGQQVYYIVKQLSDYRSGVRENPIMSAIAKNLDQKDLRPMAVYFAAKTWPAHQGAAPAAAPPKIAQCQACHQPKFEGGPPAPRLAGLSYEYLVAAMRSFADDTRTNNGDMPQMMKALSESERDAIARYLAAL
jgi:cytochrome c553